jgi:chloramphenicol-sensitive protein RarD
MGNRKHYLAAVTAFIVWGFFSIPLRALSDYSAGQILYFRITFSLAVLAIIIFAFRRASLRSDLQRIKSLPLRERLSMLTLTLAGGLLLTVNWLTFIYIVNNINIKTASFSYLICPVITAVLGYVLIKEKLTAIQWFAVFLCTVSCVIMGMNSRLELGYSVLTAGTYALYLISQRVNQGFDRMVILGVQVLFSFLLLTVASGLLVESVPSEGKFYGLIVIIAVVFTVFPLFLNLFALNKINSATIGILMYLNPLFNFSVAFIVFEEQISNLQLIGYSIIILALVLFNLPNFRKLQTAVSASKIS